MPDRVVSYDFRGNFSNLAGGLTAMGRATGDLGNRLTALDRNGQRLRAGLTTIGDAAGRTGLVAAAGLGVMFAATANFEQAMSAVEATGAATTLQLNELRDAALEAGKTTAYSATEAAGGIEALLKAGVDASDVIGGGLKGSLDLAAAGELQVAEAAEVAATAMTQFKLSGEDVSHVADLLAAGAGKAQGDVSDMSMALKQSGLVASQMGLSLEETVGTLTAFASAGLLGSDAGTAFRTMLLRLANPTGESAKLMEQLGLVAYDASGQFVGMASIAEQLQGAFEGQTQAQRDAALATIFGSDAIRAAAVLYAQGGQGVEKWTANVDDAGYAAEVAATRLDNLSGDLHKLGSALQSTLVGAGEGSQGPLRGLVQGATETVNALGEIPGPAKTAATGLLALTAVMGGAVWAGSKIVAGTAAMRVALQQLGIQATTTRAQLALVGTGSAAAAIGIGTFLDNISRMDSSGRSSDAAEAMVRNFQDLSDALDASNLGKYAGDLRINLSRLAEDLHANGAEGEYVQRVMDQLKDSTSGASAAFKAFLGEDLPFYEGETLKSERALEDLKSIIDGIGPSLFQLPFDAAASALSGYNTEVAEGVKVENDHTAALNKATQAMRDKRSEALSAFDAETRWGQAVNAATEAVNSGRKGISRFTEAGQANRGVLGELANAWNSQSTAVKNNDDRFRAARKTFIDTATAMGVPIGQAKALARELLEIPRSTVAKVEAQGAAAAAGQVNNLRDALGNLRDKTIHVNVIRNNPNGTTTSVVEPHAEITDRTSQRVGITATGRLSYTNGRTGIVGPDDSITSFNRGKSAIFSFRDEVEKAGRSVKSVRHELEKAEKAYDRERRQLQDLQQARDAFKSQVGGAYATADPFAGGLSDFDVAVSANTNDTAAARAALKAAADKGLDGALYKALAASGNLSLLQEFAGLSRAEIAQRERNYGAGLTQQNLLGTTAANHEFAKAIQAQSAVTDELAAEVKHLRAVLRNLSKDVRKGTEDGTRAGWENRNRRLADQVRTKPRPVVRGRP